MYVRSINYLGRGLFGELGDAYSRREQVLFGTSKPYYDTLKGIYCVIGWFK